MSLERTIAVVDDNQDILFIVREMLTWDGYHVICSRSSLELFDSLEKRRPDLIILDIMMPVMDGFSVLQKLKEDSETSSIPVMFLTARTDYSNSLSPLREPSFYQGSIFFLVPAKCVTPGPSQKILGQTRLSYQVSTGSVLYGDPQRPLLSFQKSF